MDTTAPSHPPKILSLSLAFLLAGLLGCSHGSQGEQAAAGSKPAAGAASGAAAPPVASTAAGSPTGAAAGSAQAPAGAGAAAAPGAPGTPAAAPPQPLSPDKLPAVVAKVNGETIKKEELVKAVEQVHSQRPMMPATAEFYHLVLDNLVARDLLLQEAKAAGTTATDAEVAEQLNGLKGKFPSPEQTFK